MAISGTVVEAARTAGVAHGISPQILLAVALVETDGVAGSVVAGRSEPLIRFEGHYFDRLLPPAPRRVARLAGLASPRAGGVRNPAGQAARWALLARAEALDGEAACASASWGLCQVMGDHGRRLGYGSARALAARARQSPEGQFEIGARFLREGRLDALLAAGDTAGFARRYNGPGYLKNAYHTKIAAALTRAAGYLGARQSMPVFGERSAAVAVLQRALAAKGYPLAADGIFGPLTRAAIEAYRKVFGPAADPRPS